MLEMRPVRPEDLAIVQQLGYAYNLELDAKETVQAVVNLWITNVVQRAQAGSHYFWLAIIQEQIIGFASFYVSSHPFNFKKTGMIQDFYIIPDFRQQGYAQQFALAVFEELRQRGVQEIHLDVLKDNVVGRRFWQKFGFEVHHYAMSMTANQLSTNTDTP